MRNKKTVILTILVLTAVGVLLIWVFMEGRKELALEQERERPVKAASRVSVQEGESVITLDRDTQMKSGIVVAAVQPISHQEELQAYGVVLQPQELMDLRNRSTGAKAQLEKTQAGLEASRKAYERLKVLHEKNRNISDKALQTAEAAWRSDEADAQAAEETLHVLKGTIRQRWGEVIAKWLWSNHPAFDRLIQQQDLLIQITLPSGASITSAPPTARIQAASGASVSANLVSPSPYTDPRIQGMSFFYRVPVRKGGLLPGLNVAAYLPAGPHVKGVVIPASAVVWWQGKGWAYILENTERFIRREIPTANSVRDGYFVAEGFAAGTRIVVRGAQLLLSEEFRSQIQMGEEESRK